MLLLVVAKKVNMFGESHLLSMLWLLWSGWLVVGVVVLRRSGVSVFFLVRIFVFSFVLALLGDLGEKEKKKKMRKIRMVGIL